MTVIQIKGQVYARAGGVNYVYLLWALAYETVFVVFAPIYLAELIFPSRRTDVWLNRGGLVAVAALFPLSSFLAWFSWTQIARPKVFHVPVYHPPLTHILAAGAAILTLVFCALGPFREALARPAPPTKPPSPGLVGLAACLWSTLWYILVLLAFGIAPQFSPALAMGGGILLVGAVVLLLALWTSHPDWGDMHQFGTIFGAVLGSMLLSFVGFMGGLLLDLYFKLGVDALAVLLFIALGLRLRRG